jgi:hypothetical protein
MSSRIVLAAAAQSRDAACIIRSISARADNWDFVRPAFGQAWSRYALGTLPVVAGQNAKATAQVVRPHGQQRLSQSD